MQMSAAEKQAFVNALDQAKKTIHPNIVICTRRYRSQTYWTFRHILIQQCGDVNVLAFSDVILSPTVFLTHIHYWDTLMHTITCSDIS